MPKKELFEVFQSQGVPINDGKYNAAPDEPPAPAPEPIPSVEASAPLEEVLSTSQQKVEAPVSQPSAKIVPIRKDTIAWLGVLSILALVLSFIVGMHFGRGATMADEAVTRRSVESLEVTSGKPSLASLTPSKSAQTKASTPRAVASTSPRGAYALQILTYKNTPKWRANAKQLVALLESKGLVAEAKQRGTKLVVLVGDYNSKADARIKSDKAVLAKIKMQGRYPFRDAIPVKR